MFIGIISLRGSWNHVFSLVCMEMLTFCELCVLYAHAQVVKRVVGLYDDGSNKPFRAAEGLEADYVHRCCSADCQTLCGPVRWRDSYKTSRPDGGDIALNSTGILSKDPPVLVSLLTIVTLICTALNS